MLKHFYFYSAIDTDKRSPVYQHIIEGTDEGAIKAYVEDKMIPALETNLKHKITYQEKSSQ